MKRLYVGIRESLFSRKFTNRGANSKLASGMWFGILPSDLKITLRPKSPGDLGALARFRPTFRPPARPRGLRAATACKEAGPHGLGCGRLSVCRCASARPRSKTKAPPGEERPMASWSGWRWGGAGCRVWLSRASTPIRLSVIWPVRHPRPAAQSPPPPPAPRPATRRHSHAPPKWACHLARTPTAKRLRQIPKAAKKETG